MPKIKALLLCGFLFSFPPQIFGASCTNGNLPPGDGSDLEVTAPCTVPAGIYHYGNVNIYNGGVLTFQDAVIHFWAKSILIENNGSLTAGTTQNPIGTAGGVVTIHLYGSDQGAGTGNGDGGQGITCKTDAICGIPQATWDSNGSTKVLLPGNITDFFYQYHPLPYDDGGAVKGFFGYKTLAVSYGGTLQLFGKKGASYGNLDPSNSGNSWTRLAKSVEPGDNTLLLDEKVDWGPNDKIVLTSTDYLPGNSEELTIVSVMPDQKTITVQETIQNIHSGQQFDLSSVPNRLQLDFNKAETRAAVALLTRSIRIVSGGDDFPTTNQDCDYDCFPAPPYHLGGHTSVRQGFKSFQVQGVEFYQLGQGGRLGHYPVHLHMARLTPENTFVEDCSVHDSMTRWITLHATQNVTLARNVGYLSIGHGFYLEDGTETDNQLYSNIGIFARAAVNNAQNPRQVPGILSFNGAFGPFPTNSDVANPSVFWIMNGWNDFQYNMAVGAGACGACYWLLPGAISGPSQHMSWESYASMQQGIGRAGLTPLKSFNGNFCSSAMNSFNTVAGAGSCNGLAILDPVSNPLSPAPTGGDSEMFYPKVGGGGRFPTECDQTDCSAVPQCADGNRDNCMVTVLDHYTTSFHWAETNFAAIWLRPQWYLVQNSVVSDVLNAGLTFITGGDYTKSNFVPGQWQLARKNVFIGNTQDNNPLASNAGPFNGLEITLDNGEVVKGLTCESGDANFCISIDRGITMQLQGFAMNQRLYSIYDGPNFQDSNAYLNITRTPVPDCLPNSQGGGGNCFSSKWMFGRILGIPVDEEGACSLPNAAIAWKQPNGFYYPPAFNSTNLFFNNVDIRHFVIEPLFKDGPFSFQSDDGAVLNAYCTYALNNPQGEGGSFSNFSAIDRQTILNDDDGTLTGFGQTISVNEDSFFNAPVETLECESASTAKTSPYDHVTTVVYPACATTGNCTDWDSDCGSTFCYGVPLYRQYSIATEQADSIGKNIRMMGMNFYQRSNLTANHGVYYVDTTVSKQSQLNGLQLAPGQQPSVNVFQGGQTYYLFLIYAKPTTHQTYQFFMGENIAFDPETSVQMVSSELETVELSFSNGNWPSNWTREYDPATGILSVTVDFNSFSQNFLDATEDRCQPASFCEWNSKSNQCQCSDELQQNNPTLYNECIQKLGTDNNTICSWAVKAIDCPHGGCLGFSVTLPQSFVANDQAPPQPSCFPSDSDWVVPFMVAQQNLAGSCFGQPLPVTSFCDAPGLPPIASHVLVGTEGDDKIKGTKGDDIILGKGGNDRISSKGGQDWISGGSGNDRISAGKGNDSIMGDEGDDEIHGSSGNDQIQAGDGTDTVNGGSGSDHCTGAEQSKSCEEPRQQKQNPNL